MRDIFQKRYLKYVKSSAGTPTKNVELIDLENQKCILTPRRLSLRSSSTIDLTGDTSKITEPEVIVIDQVLKHPTRAKRQSKIVEIIDLDETSKSTSMTCKSISSDIQCVGVRNLNSSICSISSSTSGKKCTLSNSFQGQRNTMCNVRRGRKRSRSRNVTPKKYNNINCSQGKKRVLHSSFSDSNLSEACSSNSKKPNRKNKKLNDCTNTISTSLKSAKQNTKPLSDNVLNYYSIIGKAINKQPKSKRKSPRRKRYFNIDQNNGREGLNPSVNLSNKPKTPKALRNINAKSLRIKKSPRLLKQQIVTSRNILTNKCENNIFNPNPLDVDVEGLRPVAIDGSNVAVGHGRGHFSTKGLTICVDYFFNQGHKEVKVFLPLHRKSCFTEKHLEELKSKCDIVFTPSRVIDGKQTMSYDDRFIVQYAVEFGAVIVSTDNYRDLLQENPRWKKTIHERLLMFTWIDDFLMFPMDPMGRKGPTLNEFLRF